MQDKSPFNMIIGSNEYVTNSVGMTRRFSYERRCSPLSFISLNEGTQNSDPTLLPSFPSLMRLRVRQTSPIVQWSNTWSVGGMGPPSHVKPREIQTRVTSPSTSRENTLHVEDTYCCGCASHRLLGKDLFYGAYLRKIENNGPSPCGLQCFGGYGSKPKE